MELKVADATGAISLARVLSAQAYINAQKSRGVNIVAVNESYGGGAFSAAEQTAMAANEALGILDICAAGNGAVGIVGTNNDITPFYPASYNLANKISVASTDRNDRLSSFSNFGQLSVDLAAPGEAILTTVPSTLV